MIIEVFGAKEKIFNFISLSNELPQTFVPIYFGEYEGVIDKDKYVDRGRFKKFVNDNPLGFFLYSDYCQMDITFSGIDSSIFIEIKKKQAITDVRELLYKLAELDIDYAYSSMWEERLYRNGLVKKIGASTIENWVGRDYRKYLPGIYWGNLISIEMINRIGLDISELLKSSFYNFKVNEKFYYIQMYETPSSWQDFAPDLDTLSENLTGVFFKWDIWDELEVIEDEKEYFATCSNWP